MFSKCLNVMDGYLSSLDKCHIWNLANWEHFKLS